jgi:hypothetical protein
MEKGREMSIFGDGLRNLRILKISHFCLSSETDEDGEHEQACACARCTSNTDESPPTLDIIEGAQGYRCPFCLKVFETSEALAKHILNGCPNM